MADTGHNKKGGMSREQDGQIVIDEQNALVFSSEEELFSYFAKDIDQLEKDFFSRRRDTDIPAKSFPEYEDNLNLTLEDPDEIWEDTEALEANPIYVYIRQIRGGENPLYHAAICYLADEFPSFVYLHFPTNDKDLLNEYRRGQTVYSRDMKESPIGALDGDALNEGDELAAGLYNAMMRLRSEDDIPEDKFVEYHHLREESVEDADEIWRNADTMGNTLVNFIKDFSEEGQDNPLFYIVVTVEDAASNTHALLFSFPTSDENLVDRYRNGENLQAEEVVQEASH